MTHDRFDAEARELARQCLLDPDRCCATPDNPDCRRRKAYGTPPCDRCDHVPDEIAVKAILAFARRAHAAGLREAGKIINESAGSLDSVRETVLDRAAELEAEAQTKGAPHEP